MREAAAQWLSMLGLEDQPNLSATEDANHRQVLELSLLFLHLGDTP